MVETPTCPNCGTVLLPGNRICPFCRMPIAPPPRSPPVAPSPEVAPVPPRVCGSCRTPLAVPQQVTLPRRAEPPISSEAHVYPRCGRVELYRPRDET